MDTPNRNSFELNLNFEDSRVESDLFKRSIRLGSSSFGDDSQMNFEGKSVEMGTSNFNETSKNTFGESEADLSLLNESFDKMSIFSKDTSKSSAKRFTGSSKISMAGRLLIKPGKSLHQAKNNQIERLGCICK